MGGIHVQPPAAHARADTEWSSIDTHMQTPTRADAEWSSIDTHVQTPRTRHDFHAYAQARGADAHETLAAAPPPAQDKKKRSFSSFLTPGSLRPEHRKASEKRSSALGSELAQLAGSRTRGASRTSVLPPPLAVPQVAADNPVANGDWRHGAERARDLVGPGGRLNGSDSADEEWGHGGEREWGLPLGSLGSADGARQRSVSGVSMRASAGSLNALVEEEEGDDAGKGDAGGGSTGPMAAVQEEEEEEYGRARVDANVSAIGASATHRNGSEPSWDISPADGAPPRGSGSGSRHAPPIRSTPRDRISGGADVETGASGSASTRLQGSPGASQPAPQPLVRAFVRQIAGADASSPERFSFGVAAADESPALPSPLPSEEMVQMILEENRVLFLLLREQTDPLLPL
jgi:hypothetical protein